MCLYLPLSEGVHDGSAVIPRRGESGGRGGDAPHGGSVGSQTVQDPNIPFASATSFASSF